VKDECNDGLYSENESAIKWSGIIRCISLSRKRRFTTETAGARNTRQQPFTIQIEKIAFVNIKGLKGLFFEEGLLLLKLFLLGMQIAMQGSKDVFSFLFSLFSFPVVFVRQQSSVLMQQQLKRTTRQ